MLKDFLLENNSPFKNPYEDFIKLFLPSLIIILLLPFLNLNTNEIVAYFLFYVLDDGHIYSTFLEVFFDSKKRSEKRVVFYVIFSLLLNLLVTYLFPGNFFVFIFYIMVIHYYWQGFWITSLYCTKLKLQTFWYLVLTLPSLFLLHLRKINLGDDSTYSPRPISFDNIADPKLVSFYFENGRIFFGAIIILASLFIFYKKIDGRNSILFHAGLFFVAFTYFNNPLWSMALLAVGHSVTFYFFYERRITKTHSVSFVRKYSKIILATAFLIGGILEANIEEGSMYFPNHWRNVAFAVAFFPMTLHYIFDFFEMRKSNDRFKKSFLTSD